MRKILMVFLPVLLLISAACDLTSYPFDQVTDPFNFNYEISDDGVVDLIVLNCYMNNVRTLLSDTTQAAGTYSSNWDLLDESGVRVPDGLYYIRTILDDTVVETQMYEVYR
jgi:flagellar hook assembly protein FlgD